MVIVVNPGPQRSSALSGRDSATRLPDQGSFRQYPCQAGACRIKILGRAASKVLRPPQYFLSPQLVRNFSAMVASERSPRLAMRLPCLRLPYLLSLLSVAWKSSRWTLLPSFATSSAVSIYLVCSTGTWPTCLVADPMCPRPPSLGFWSAISCSPASPCTPFLSGLPLLSPNLWVCCQARRTCSTMTVVVARSIICFARIAPACSRPSSSGLSIAFDLWSRSFTRTRHP